MNIQGKPCIPGSSIKRPWVDQLVLLVGLLWFLILLVFFVPFWIGLLLCCCGCGCCCCLFYCVVFVVVFVVVDLLGLCFVFGWAPKMQF